MAPLLQAALNGSRTLIEHPAVPRTPEALAHAAREAAAAGAGVVHLHPYAADGKESFDAEGCAAALRAVRAASPGLPISLSTSAEIEPDPARRFALIASWHDLPDLVTVNQGETGIRELCAMLLGRGVSLEAGLLSVSDAEAFVRSGLAPHCVRVLVEPLETDAAEAVQHAAAIEDVLNGAGITLEQVHHGDGLASWAVCERALERGHGIRTGLEDTLLLPDGTRAADNTELVRAARALMEASSP